MLLFIFLGFSIRARDHVLVRLEAWVTMRFLRTAAVVARFAGAWTVDA
jgi:hypothetical protein